MAHRRPRWLTPRGILRCIQAGAVVLVLIDAGHAYVGAVGTGPLIQQLAQVPAIALGFGSQQEVQNIIAGVLLGIERRFAPGDELSAAGQSGTVIRRRLRITEGLNADGDQITWPNLILFSSPYVVKRKAAHP